MITNQQQGEMEAKARTYCKHHSELVQGSQNSPMAKETWKPMVSDLLKLYGALKDQGFKILHVGYLDSKMPPEEVYGWKARKGLDTISVVLFDGKSRSCS